VPIAPFRPKPVSPDMESRYARLAILAAMIGIVAVLVAYAISPGVRHAIRRAAGSVKHAVGHVFHDEDHKLAPALPREVLLGPAVDLRTLRGHRALVSFWSATCTGCDKQASAMQLLSQSAVGHRRIVGIDYSEGLPAGRNYIMRNHWTFTNLGDAQGLVGKRYGIRDARGLPVTFVLDSTGHIVNTLHGPQTQAGLAKALRG
jgi:peroxiredoxin